MEISNYAPVIIPTLNRYEHLKKCIASLESCTGASETDVYVALDYPPSDRYKAGWQKINEYLRGKELENGFKNLFVIRRNYNYGLKGPSRNTKMLIDRIIPKYDRWIFSEDDNIFSPNFLEYVNKGLELYKNDMRIVAICGYKNDFDCMHLENNNFAQHSLFQAWGFGIWRNRFLEASENMTPSYYKSILHSGRKWRKCYKYWPVWFNFLFKNVQSTYNYLPLHDINLSFYILNEGKYVICPTVSKVRNMGFDSEATTTIQNKGRMAERAEIENNMTIDQNKEFEYVGDPFCYVDENSYNTAMWDQKWEGYKDRGILFAYTKVILFRLKCFLGIV